MATEIYRIEHDGGSFEEVTEAELTRAAAGREVDRMVKRYLQDHPHASYGEGLRRVLATHPGLKAAYSGGVPSVPEQLRMAGAGARAEVIVEHGSVRYHVHQYDPPAPRDWSLFAPLPGEALTIGYPVGQPVWTPILMEYDPGRWGQVEVQRRLEGLGFPGRVVHVDRTGGPARIGPGGVPLPVRYWALLSDQVFEDFPRKTIRG